MTVNHLSHPTWVCGLKLENLDELTDTVSVTPYVGVWIETDKMMSLKTQMNVTPYVGVWIETFAITGKLGLTTSHPTWVCGLKRAERREHRRDHASHPTWVCGLKHIIPPFI